MIAGQLKTSKWYIQYFDFFFSCITIGYLLHVLTWYLPDKMAVAYPALFRLSYKYLLAPAVAATIYLAAVGSKQKIGKFNKDRVHAALYGLIRFWLAAGISIYGFAKTVGTQFQGADEITLRDSLLGDVSGNYLTWYYFNLSHPFMLIIGYLQIGGALLLLFRRTTLLGIFSLLPVMVTIVMIDLLYGIPATPTAIAIAFTGALIYLLFLHAPLVINLFFKAGYALPAVGNPWVKHALRLTLIVFAFTGIYRDLIRSHSVPKTSDSGILGKWTVQTAVINGKEIASNAWQTNAATWASIYFFSSRYCAIASNPYFFDRTKPNYAEYHFNQKGHSLSMYVLNTKDSLRATIDFPSINKMLLKGLLGKDSIQLQLWRVKL